jgi:tetratricopeptide (TPR) repeat protein
LLGDHATALQLLVQALPVVVDIGDRHTEGAFHLFEAVCHRGVGDLDRAARCARCAVDLCREVGNPNFEIEALGVLGQIALDRDDACQAVEWFDQAVRVAEENGQALDGAEQRSHLALAHSRLEHHEEALALSTRALAIVEQQPDAGERLKVACFERAQIESAARGAQAAQPYLERAYEHLLALAERITDPDLRRSFLENVQLNRDIAEAHRLGRVSPRTRRLTVRLARAGAPLGRRLRDDEYVDVTWTVEARAHDGAAGRTARRKCILHLLQEAQRQSASPTVADLASVLGVSDRTVKRDLAALRAEGHAVRTRGTLES